MGLKELQNLFNCSISLKPIKDPYFLECGHVFEKSSIMNLYNSGIQI